MLFKISSYYTPNFQNIYSSKTTGSSQKRFLRCETKLKFKFQKHTGDGDGKPKRQTGLKQQTTTAAISKVSF